MQSTAMLRLCGQLQCDDCRPGVEVPSQIRRVNGCLVSFKSDPKKNTLPASSGTIPPVFLHSSSVNGSVESVITLHREIS